MEDVVHLAHMVHQNLARVRTVAPMAGLNKVVGVIQVIQHVVGYIMKKQMKN